MVNLDSTLWIQIVNFLLLILILHVLLFKPILRIIDQRKGQLAGSEDKIRRLKASVEEKVAAYEEKLRLAKQEAARQKSEMVREANDTAKGIVDAVRGEIPRMMEEFNGEVRREVSQAKRVLQEQSQRISLEIAEKVLGRSVQ